MKNTTLTLAAFSVLTISATAAITYIDADVGTVEYDNGGTWDSGSGWQTTTSSSSDNLYQLRTSGPGANAAGTTAYNSGHGENAPALRMTVAGLDAGLTYEFYLYSIDAGGSDIFQAAVSSDTGGTATVPALTTYQNGTNVLANGDLGNVGSGDQRTRLTLTQVTGFTSYSVYIDDFNPDPGSGDRVSLDGIGFQAVPEPSSAALLGLGGLALILRRRK